MGVESEASMATQWTSRLVGGPGRARVPGRGHVGPGACREHPVPTTGRATRGLGRQHWDTRITSTQGLGPGELRPASHEAVIRGSHQPSQDPGLAIRTSFLGPAGLLSPASVTRGPGHAGTPH